MHNALLLHEISRLTQRAVAEHTGMSVSTLKRMLNGTHASELDNKRALVQVYCREIGCDLKDIDLDTVELTPAMVEQAKCRR